jgi:hypothetical protein
MATRNPYRQITASANPAAPAPAGQPARVPTPKKAHLTSGSDEQHYDEQGNFNPKAYGGFREEISQAVGSKTARMFDTKGEINAYDNKDALQQIAYLLQSVTKKAAPGLMHRSAASDMDPDARRKVLAAAMQDPYV